MAIGGVKSKETGLIRRENVIVLYNREIRAPFQLFIWGGVSVPARDRYRIGLFTVRVLYYRK